MAHTTMVLFLSEEVSPQILLDPFALAEASEREFLESSWALREVSRVAFETSESWETVSMIAWRRFKTRVLPELERVCYYFSYRDIRLV